MKREVRIVINCDEGFVADTLREFAGKYEDEFGDWHECEHGSGFLEFIEVPDPEPSLEDVFSTEYEAILDERERKRLKLQKMDEEERAWIEQMLPRLEFLKERGFKVAKYFGGIVYGWPYNYITISKGLRRVEIMGATVRRTDGTIDHVSGQFYNTEKLTMEDLIKKIAVW